ncbi:MAG: hypothetical protein JXR73_15345 [Candidatus Omnitrophica bacterium]|nr:hypothetical protein [Candidatus Omnitrophota bacterium]
MEWKQTLAVLWKEYRQLRSVFAGLISIVFVLAYLIFILGPEEQNYMELQEVFSGLQFMLFLPALAFFFGCGARMVESANRLESFLYLKPMLLTKRLSTYFLFGLAGWFVWLFFYIFIQVGFFGMEIIRPIKNISTENLHFSNTLVSYFNFTMHYFAAYTVTFSAGILLPNLYFCGGISFGAYFGSLYWIASDNGMGLDLWKSEFLPLSVYILLILPIPILLYATLQIYRRIPMGCR